MQPFRQGLRAAQQVSDQYRTAFEVDISDENRRSRAQLQPPR